MSDLSLEKKTAIAALADNGLEEADIAKALGISLPAVKRARSEAELTIKANLAEYARIHLVAAKVAAEKGRAEPAQWALERMDVVKPVAPAAPAGGGGPVIKIGILLPGLSRDAQTEVVQADAVTLAEGVE